MACLVLSLKGGVWKLEIYNRYINKTEFGIWICVCMNSESTKLVQIKLRPITFSSSVWDARLQTWMRSITVRSGRHLRGSTQVHLWSLPPPRTFLTAGVCLAVNKITWKCLKWATGQMMTFLVIFWLSGGIHSPRGFDHKATLHNYVT